VKKELLLSAALFAIGLGFFMGFRTAYQQAITVILCAIFIVLPIYYKVVDTFHQFKAKKQHKAAL
jgi:hypothetical protein